MTLFRIVTASAVFAMALGPARAQPVFVTDFYNGSILRVDSQTGATVPPPVSPTPLPPAALVYGPGGFLYTANQNPSLTGGQGSISQINPATGAVVNTINFTTPINPGGLAFAPNGDVFVTNFSDPFSSASGSVQRFSIAGNVATPVGLPLATGLTQPTALLLRGTDLYFTETNSAGYYTGVSNIPGGRLSVLHNALTTPSLQTLINGAAGTGFSGMAIAGNTLYYADLIGGAIDRFDVGTGTALTALVNPGGSLNVQFPSGLYLDSANSLLVASLGGANPPSPGQGHLRRYSTVTPDTQIGGNIVSGIFAGAVAPVPEPGTLALVGGAAAAGFAAWRRRRASP